MSDIFNRSVSTLGGVFTADRAKLAFAGGLVALVQGLNFSYSQTITRLYEVGGPNIYYVGGRTQGRMGINRVVGPSRTVKAFYTKYGDVCQAKQNTINLTLTETDCSTGSSGPTTYDMKNCVIDSVSVGVEASAMIITENTSLMYSSLEMSGG